MDRLSALMSRFDLTVSPCPEAQANFRIFGTQDEKDPRALVLQKEQEPLETPEGQTLLASAYVEWGGTDNPLLAALPGTVRFSLLDDPEMTSLARLFLAELAAARCGAASVLNRLGEVLIVRLMRKQIETGALQTGLLAALADPRLSRAVVAMHDQPDRPWRLGSLAEEAGLSVSRFADLFRARVGLTPLAYLRQWRLILAKQDIERGDQIQRVANRYCYGSPEALSRAFSGHFGQSPREVRSLARTGP